MPGVRSTAPRFAFLLTGSLVGGACGGVDDSLFGGATTGAGGDGGGSSATDGAGSASAQTTASASSAETTTATGTTIATTATTASTGGGEICPSGGDPCTTCQSTSCPKIWCECANNSECGALVACGYACNGDPGCEQGCLTAHESGIADAFLAAHCGATDCPGECPNTDPLSPCERCLFEECESKMTKCLANGACRALLRCLQECGDDEACQTLCYTTHALGATDADALVDCAQNECNGKCPG
jgi:hypothetical protein